MSDHHPTLPPSSAGALLQCCHYRPAQRETQEMQRGTLLDRAVSAMVSGKPAPGDGLTDAELALAERASGWVLQNIGAPRSQVRLSVSGAAGEITFGTADFVGHDHATGMPVVADLKTGQKRDVSAQLNLYALGLMQSVVDDECRCCVLWVDHDEVEEWTITSDEAGALAEDLHRRVTEKPYPPEESDYCAWCGARQTCPLWTYRASQALSVRPVDECMAEIAKHKLEAIAESPELTGAFLVAWRAAEKLVEAVDLEGKAKRWLETGQQVPGWKLRPMPGRESVSVKALKEWAARAGVELPEDLVRRSEDGVALIREKQETKQGKRKEAA